MLLVRSLSFFVCVCVCEKELGIYLSTCSEFLLLWSHPLSHPLLVLLRFSTNLDAVVCDVEGERLAWVRGGHASSIPVSVYGNFEADFPDPPLPIFVFSFGLSYRRLCICVFVETGDPRAGNYEMESG